MWSDQKQCGSPTLTLGSNRPVMAALVRQSDLHYTCCRLVPPYSAADWPWL